MTIFKRKNKKIIQKEKKTDYSIKVGTIAEAFWTDVLKGNEQKLAITKDNYPKDIMLLEAVIEMCKKKIKDSK